MAKKRGGKFYFTKDTEEAIIQYNECEDIEVRNQIYTNRIHGVFEKLTENVFHVYKTYDFDMSYEEVKHEVIAHLNDKMGNYTRDMGKAYSFFTVIARNWLWHHSKKNYRNKKRKVDIMYIDETRDVIQEVHREEFVEDTRDFTDMFIEHVDERLDEMFPRMRDRRIADAILELFRRREFIENFNKKALYIMIREMTDCKTQYITGVVNVLKSKYKRMYEVYRKTGRVADPEEVEEESNEKNNG